MQIEYSPEEVKTYVEKEFFRVIEPKYRLGMLVVDGRVSFLGWDHRLQKYSTIEYTNDISVELLKTFLAAYDERAKNDST